MKPVERSYGYEIDRLREEFQNDLASLRSELELEISDLRDELQRVRDEIP